ncbi:hypothetical protein WDL1CHR_05278 [Variovorax sp. WDL1]|nr:hypothetical protein CHC06_07304 [Variovorax sp. B2]PNG48388.1 hypothetical protein CHC07_07564 [Variovorax sp. B4]VTV14803.1 hypothetical protein WDL1CHR_05278 [Variovorax sp. WDL1]
MCREPGQIQPECGLEKASIARPKLRTCSEASRGEQVKIDIADPDAEQPLVAKKRHHLDVARYRDLGQGLQRADRLVPPGQAAQSNFRDDVRVHEDFTFLQQRLQS